MFTTHLKAFVREKTGGILENDKKLILGINLRSDMQYIVGIYSSKTF